MGNCIGCGCFKSANPDSETTDPATNGRKHNFTAANGEAEGSFRGNDPLNSFMSLGRPPPSRQLSQVSRATSAISWRSAHSHFDDEVSSNGDLDLDRWNSHTSHGDLDRLPGGGSPPLSRASFGSHELRASGGRRPSGSSPLSGNSPGTVTPPDGHPSRSGSLSPATLCKAWDSQTGRSSKKRPSHAGSITSTLSRRLSTAGSDAAVPDHEAEESAAHTDLAAHDKATLAAANAIFGRHAASFEELPLLPTAPWNRKPGYLGHLTAEQEDKLAAMRSRFPFYNNFHTDHDLLRFLRARSFDLAATQKLYNKYCTVYRERLLVSPAPVVRPTLGRQWDLQHVELFPHRPEGVTADMRTAFRCFLHVMVYGADRLGRPVVYLRVMDVVKNSMSQYVPLPMRISLQSASNELNKVLMMMASAKAGHQIDEFMQVVDVKGPTVLQMIKHIRSTDNQAEFAHNSDYVPETLGKVVVINAPFGAGPAWNLAKVFIPPATREKISICGSDYKAELLKYIDADSLPSCYGGSAQFEWTKHDNPKNVYK